MKKLFLLIPAMLLTMMAYATKPTITIDGNKSDWSDIPMLSEPGTWPMLKVIPAADAELGTNALVYMVENTEDFDPTWAKYPKAYVDKDYSTETRAFSTEECWQYLAMGVDYMATTGVNSGGWISFPKGISDNNKVIEIGFPATYITDLESKFGFAMYYNSGAWYCPKYQGDGVITRNGYLYKARSFTSIPNTLSAANAYTHQSIGECSTYVDYGIRGSAWAGDTALWAAFPIELTDQGVYDFTANVTTNSTSWKFEFWLVNVETNAVVAHIDAPASNISDSKTSYNFGIMDLSSVPTGKYMLKVKNRTCHSQVMLNSVVVSYVGGEVQDISTSVNTTLPINATWFSGCTRDNDKTYVQFPDGGNSSAWVKWNIATSETKMYDVTVNINTDKAHQFGVAIYEDENEDPVASVAESGYVSTTGVLALNLGRVNLAGSKNYVVKVTNITSGSTAKLIGVTFAPVLTTVTALPGTINFNNAVLSTKAHVTNGMLYFNEIGDTDPRGQWAQWEATTDHNGLFLFTMGVTSENEQTYKITILNSGYEEVDFFEKSLGSGDKTIKHYFSLPTGSYFVKVENTRSYSKGHLTSLVVTEPDNVVTLDEEATDNTSWSSYVVAPEAEGPLYDVQIKRTIVGGMYNTLCLPFEVTSAQAREIFGSDVQLRTLASATIEEGDFVLNLNFTNTSSMYPGTPHLIMTSRDIVNPVFTGVKFTRATPAATTKANADFIGTFIKGTITASENNLFMGANNTLYFPTEDTEILGMRGYFVIHDAPVGVIQRAQIVEADAPAITTEINRVDTKANASVKTIENGQLVIIRDGKKYNVMGIRMK